MDKGRPMRAGTRPVARRVRAIPENSEVNRMRLLSTQTQWATGQGFFHSGSLTDMARDVPVMTYVVDCGAVGSQKPVTREIQNFSTHPKYFAASHSPDIVFLTHFDFDHISGVKDLHATTNPRRYVIPATNRLELLYLAARSMAQRTAEDLPDWYWEFLGGPAEWLRALDGAPQVIEVFDDQERNEEGPGGLVPDNQDDGPDGVPQRVFAPGRSVRSGQAVAGINGRRSGGLIWEWRTYVTRSAASHLVKFEKVLMKSVKEFCDRKSDSDVVQWLVDNHWAELRKAYDASSKVRNLVSLCVYSGPLPDMYPTADYFSRAWCVDCQPPPGSGGPGWLGAGDACLDSDAEADAFVAAFRDVMQHVGTFAVPHHGARSSWNDLVLAGFTDLPAPTVVVGACPGFRGWEHPSIEVIRAVSDIGSAIRIVTKEESSRWNTMTVVWFRAPISYS